MSAQDRTNACGCCEGTAQLTPQDLYNRAGLAQLDYRVGTHARFKSSMLSRISTQPRLRGLTTREDDDMSIALMDSAAAVLDIWIIALPGSLFESQPKHWARAWG